MVDDVGADLNSSAAVMGPKSNNKRRRVALAAGVACALALVVGLSVGLSRKRSNNNKKGDEGESSRSPEAMSGRLSAYSTSMMSGYSECDDFRGDLEAAARAAAQAHVDRLALQYYHDQYFWGIPRGGSFGGGLEEAVMMDSAVQGGASAKTPSTGGETDFGTNNQVEGVDEADFVKSDGTHVYAAYGQNLVVWDARTGKEVSRTKIPTEDDDGRDECLPDTEDGTLCYQLGWGRTEIVSLLLHENRLAVVAQSPGSNIVPFFAEDGGGVGGGAGNVERPTSTLQGHKATRVFVYDTTGVGEGAAVTPLNLVKRKDVDGYFQSARSVNEHAHVVTSTSVNLWENLYKDLEPPNFVKNRRRLRSRRRTTKGLVATDIFVPGDEIFDIEDLPEEEYKRLAKSKTDEIVPSFADRLAKEILGTSTPDKDTCRRMVRLASFTKPNNKEGNDDDNDSSAPFVEAQTLDNFAKVTSFSLTNDDEVEGGTATATSRRLMTTRFSGMFVPMNSYSKAVYSSATKLIIAGEAYQQDDEGNWKERTLLFSFGLDQAKSTPESVGEVPGSLLNQFSMDHHTDDDGKHYLRVATTNWAEWGMVDDQWTQTEESDSQVTVLELPDATNGAEEMRIVGQVGDLGKGERIFAVRFLGKRGFVVTFEQIDPFYTLDLEDPTNPVVVGELKIPGFSNYLHPIGGPDGNLVLAVGQDVDVDTGRQNGLQIALFDVSDMENPRQVKKYVEGGEYSYSNAQSDHRAFRWLEETKLLIIPLSRYGVDEFDGFAVYDVFPDDLDKKIDRRLEISHRRTSPDTDSVSASYCWSYDRLEARSMVFDGNVMTMKGHTVLSHDLDSEGSVLPPAELWVLNLDEGRQGKTRECKGWW